MNIVKKFIFGVLIMGFGANNLMAMEPEEYCQWAARAGGFAHAAAADGGNLTATAERQTVVDALVAIRDGAPAAGLDRQKKINIAELRRLAGIAHDAFAPGRPRRAAMEALAQVTETAALLRPGLGERASRSVHRGVDASVGYVQRGARAAARGARAVVQVVRAHSNPVAAALACAVICTATYLAATCPVDGGSCSGGFTTYAAAPATLAVFGLFKKLIG